MALLTWKSAGSKSSFLAGVSQKEFQMVVYLVVSLFKESDIFTSPLSWLVKKSLFARGSFVWELRGFAFNGLLRGLTLGRG